MFKPVLIGGQDVSSLRAYFDDDDKNVIVASNKRIQYYDIEAGTQSGSSSIPDTKLNHDEIVVACEKVETSLYLLTNHGKIFIWCLETRDWINELSLPVDSATESLVSCKILGKRQYLFTVRDNAKIDDVKLYYSMSRSERERPKQRELVGECDTGDQTSFDIGCAISPQEIENEGGKSAREKLAKQRILTFVKGTHIHFQKLGIAEKFQLKVDKQIIANHNFTCVRSNLRRPMIAAGDAFGRIYAYTGDSKRPWSNRSKLHWHSTTVNDLCFSSTGQTLYSVGCESGCVVVWDLSGNHLGQKLVIAGLGMPIRHVNCSDKLQQLILSTEDNELIFVDTDHHSKPMKTLTRRTYDMYLNNDPQALRTDSVKGSPQGKSNSIGLLWHSKTDSLVTNGKTGRLQFYSPNKQVLTEDLDALKCKILSLEPDGRVLPSDITKAALSCDGEWIAFYETRDSGDGLFPDVRLHIYQKPSSATHWSWIQTADRLHPTAEISDLKFSPDNQYLVSLGNDGSFHILYKVNLDPKKETKQMYAKGFFGNVPENLGSQVAFSQDSSVLAIGLKNETTLIWMIVDPYKLEYECQLSRDDKESLANEAENNDPERRENTMQVIGLHFGHYEPPRSIAPLCEVRSKYIRIWNILNAQSSSGQMLEYLVSEAPSPDMDRDPTDEFTAAAFDQSAGDNQVLDHFAVCTKRNLVYVFELKINQDSRTLSPLIVIDASIPQCSLQQPRYYTELCFVGNPILDIDEQCHQDLLLIKLINRLCLMTNRQELVGFTDRLTLERQSAINNCNEIKTYELSELNDYFIKSTSSYRDELQDMPQGALDTQSMTEKQKRMKQKLEVQRMLKSLFLRVPSHNLPRMELLGPLILDKLV